VKEIKSVRSLNERDKGCLIYLKGCTSSNTDRELASVNGRFREHAASLFWIGEQAQKAAARMEVMLACKMLAHVQRMCQKTQITESIKLPECIYQ
jgi:tRNA 2-selenouridine synthase SelU